MDLEIIDGELGIAACKKGMFPTSCGYKEKLVLFYYAKRDWIVFNAEHPYYEEFLAIVHDYMEFDNLQRKEFMEYINSKPIIKRTFDKLNQILRIRRNIQERRG